MKVCKKTYLALETCKEFSAPEESARRERVFLAVGRKMRRKEHWYVRLKVGATYKLRILGNYTFQFHCLFMRPDGGFFPRRGYQDQLVAWTGSCWPGYFPACLKLETIISKPKEVHAVGQYNIFPVREVLDVGRGE